MENSNPGSRESTYMPIKHQLWPHGASTAHWELSATTPAAVTVLAGAVLNSGRISWSLAELGG